MDWPDYLRDQATMYRQQAEHADDPFVKSELLQLASVCEEVANDIEDHQTASPQVARRPKFKLTSLVSGLVSLADREQAFPRQQCQSGSLPPVASRSGPVHALVD